MMQIDQPTLYHSGAKRGLLVSCQESVHLEQVTQFKMGALVQWTNTQDSELSL